MGMYFGIPSYKRCGKVKTIAYLINMGVDKNNIIVSTQTIDDYDQYSKEYGHICKVIYNNGNSPGDNRNTLIRYFKNNNINRYCIIDDDCNGIIVKNVNKAIKLDSKQFNEMIEYIVATMIKYKACYCGFSNSTNPFYMRDKVNINQIFGEAFNIYVDFKYEYDTRFRLAEGFELCCNIINNGDNTIKFCNIAGLFDVGTEGGCSDIRVNNDLDTYTDRIIRMYNKLNIYKTKNGALLIRR